MGLRSIFLVLVMTTSTTFMTQARDIEMKTFDRDQAAVATIVEAVGILADRGEFDALARLFADDFVLDYSSLTGRAAERRTPLALMKEWASVLPGFDLTRHKVSGVEVDLAGDTATARADVVADHWIHDRHWQVVGGYDYAFAKQEGRWKITSMTFTLSSEKGSRDVFGAATKAAAEKAMPGYSRVVAERNKQTVRTAFRLLEKENIAAFVDLFADDGVQINPYHGNVFPKGASGKQDLLSYWKPVPQRFDGMKFEIEQLLATEDPNIVFVRYRGEIRLKDDAGVYRNEYYSTFRFDRSGKIKEYVEIFDPIVAARGFGLLDQLR